MALSNLHREPRREITESVVGITVFAILVLADYRFAVWFQALVGGPPGELPMPIAMILGLIFGLAILATVYFTHFLGEIVCRWLRNMGLEVRPKDRY